MGRKKKPIEDWGLETLPLGWCYIAGPMSGIEQFNFPAFDAAAENLRLEGWEVISPAEMDRDAGFDETECTGFEVLTDEMKQDFARRDLAALLRVDSVYVLPGWENSTGATHEVQIAHWLGLPVREFETGWRVKPTSAWSGKVETAVEEEPFSFLNKRAQVLLTAEGLVNGDRNAQYGDPSQDFRRTASLWNTYLGDKGFIEAHDVAAMMALLKISRIAWSPSKLDSWVDLAGYAACGADCVEP